MIDRRVFLAGLGVTAASARAGHARSASASGQVVPGGLQDAANLHRLYRRLRYSNSDIPVFWWKRGRRYGIVGNVMTPLFDMHVGSVYQCRDLDEDRYEVVSATANYAADLDSGELLQDWANPLSGRTVRLSYPAPRRSVSVYSYAHGIVSKAEMPGMRVVGRHVVEPVELIGSEVWLREERWLDADVIATGQVMKVHDMYALASPLAALRDPAIAFVPASEHFNDYNDWSPRFEMADLPGISVARCFGRKVASFDEMPDDFLRLTRQIHPNAFRELLKSLG